MHRRGNDRTLVASVLGSVLLWMTVPAHACTADNAIRGDEVASAEELLALPGLPRVLRVRAEMGDSEFDSLDELPRPVTRVVIDALRDRLGDELSERAQFVLGRIVVQAGASSRRPFGYRLRFRVGLSVPCFIVVEADDTGTLSAPIAYPDVRRDAAKQRVLSLEEVLERAFSPDFGRRKLHAFETGLIYHARTDELVWRIAIHRGRVGRALDRSEIMISAHTGLIVDIRNSMSVD